MSANLKPALSPKTKDRQDSKDDEDLVGPSDRRGRDRRAKPERRSFASLREEDQPSGSYNGGPVASAPVSAGPYMAIIITAAIGAMYKLYYLVTIVMKFGIAQNELLVFDQLAMLLVFVGLIIFAIGAKKS